MTALARADLESLLRARSLDRTLTSAAPPRAADEQAVAAAGLEPLDAQLGGGFPRGQLSEIAGPPSTGRTTIAAAALAAATRRGELTALVDALDRFDVDSAAAAGIDLDRLLWIRGFVVPNPGLCRDLNRRALEQALRALALVLQAGNFGVVVLDLAGAPADALRRLPFTTWLRLQRMMEGTQTACVLVGDKPMARSSGGVTLVVSRGSGVESQQSRVESRVEPGVESRAKSGVESGVESSVPGRGASQLFGGIDIAAHVIQAPHHQPRIPNRGSRVTEAAGVRLYLQAAV